MPIERAVAMKYPQLFFCTMAIVTMLAELSILRKLLQTDGFSIAASLHLLVVLLLAIWLYNAKRLKRDDRLLLLLLVMVAITGPFGAGICLLSAMAYMLMEVDVNESAAKWITNFSAYGGAQELNALESGMQYGQLALNQDNASCCDTQPFSDILIGGTVLQKQMAIAKITRHFQPCFAPLLLNALSDVNAAVRVQAATAIAKIERDFMMEYLRRKKKIKSASDEAGLQMADLCDNYAYSGILDEAASSNLRATAIGIYEENLSRHKDQDQQLCLARLYLRSEQTGKACSLLEDIIGSGNEDASAILWYMEALFRLKEFSRLRQLVKEYGYLLKDFANDSVKDFGSSNSKLETKDMLGVWGFEGGVSYAA